MSYSYQYGGSYSAYNGYSEPHSSNTGYGFRDQTPPTGGPDFGSGRRRSPSPPRSNFNMDDDEFPAYTYDDEEPDELEHEPAEWNGWRKSSTREQLLKYLRGQGVSKYKAMAELDRRFEDAAPKHRATRQSSSKPSSSPRSGPSTSDMPPRGRPHASSYDAPPRAQPQPNFTEDFGPGKTWKDEEEMWAARYLDLLNKGCSRSIARSIIAEEERQFKVRNGCGSAPRSTSRGMSPPRFSTRCDFPEPYATLLRQFIAEGHELAMAEMMVRDRMVWDLPHAPSPPAASTYQHRGRSPSPVRRSGSSHPSGGEWQPPIITRDEPSGSRGYPYSRGRQDDNRYGSYSYRAPGWEDNYEDY